jgi:hypothetical protein
VPELRRVTMRSAALLLLIASLDFYAQASYAGTLVVPEGTCAIVAGETVSNLVVSTSGFDATVNGIVLGRTACWLWNDGWATFYRQAPYVVAAVGQGVPLAEAVERCYVLEDQFQQTLRDWVGGDWSVVNFSACSQSGADSLVTEFNARYGQIVDKVWMDEINGFVSLKCSSQSGSSVVNSSVVIGDEDASRDAYDRHVRFFRSLLESESGTMIAISSSGLLYVTTGHDSVQAAIVHYREIVAVGRYVEGPLPMYAIADLWD